MSTMSRWVGKTAVVTGASSGIGAAIAAALVENGVQVVGLARREEKIRELANTLDTHKGKLYALKADITNEEDIVRAFKWIEDNLGPVHILINNAGILKNTTLLEGSTEDFKQILDTNVLGLVTATREAVKSMRAGNVDGHVIHINSGAGHKVPKITGMNVYSASKFAVTALAETLRNDLAEIASGIKVTSLSPGVVETDIFESGGHSLNEFKSLFGFLVPKDIADAVVYVLGTPPHVQIEELIIKPVGAIK